MKFTSFSRLMATSLTLLFAFSLVGCGQKGDLYLEKEKTTVSVSASFLPTFS